MTAHQVIIAEDNRVLLDVMRFNLMRAGFEVRTAIEGGAALKLMEEQPADLLITDCQMPGMSGLELVRRIRSTLRFCDLPVLFCTAKGYEIGRETLDDLRLPIVLCKPFSPAEMIQRALQLVTENKLIAT